jgi:phage gp36-like protein
MAALHLKDSGAALLMSLSFANPALAVASVIVTPQGLVTGAGALVASSVISAGAVLLTLSGGADGERYDVATRATDASGANTERKLTVAVLDPNWSMADGSAGWLSILEFVQKFGLDEAVRATDPDRSGIIDRVYLIGALRDAQSEVQLNLAARYNLPLTAVPDVVKSAIADLTAVRLYHRAVPDSVGDAAKAARAMLKRIADGAVTLPGVAGIEVEASSATSDPILFDSGGRTYPDELSGYGAGY